MNLKQTRNKHIAVTIFESLIVLIAIGTLVLFFARKELEYLIITAIFLAVSMIVFVSFYITEKRYLSLHRSLDILKVQTFKLKLDPLTNIYTRDAFYDDITPRINSKPNAQFNLIRFDIDRFSVFNDVFGSIEGDNLLKHIGLILKENQYKYDIRYCRLYKDVFLILFDGDELTLGKLIDDIGYGIKEFTDMFNISVTFGVCKITDYKDFDLARIIDCAKLAAKPLKGKYDKKYGVYKEEMTKGRLKEQKILNDMNPALINHEFTIYLQPKYNIETNEIVGAESLVRWIQGSNVISPGEFIPIFEQNGFIAKLDVYVWEETLKYLKWRKDNKLELFPISVNVSRAFLSISNFIDVVNALVKKYDIEPKYLELEITETIFADINVVKDTVDRLRGYGYKVLMDDFGSGYSSLNVLKDIAFDVVKIDLKFFSKTDEKSLLVIQKVIELCNELNIPAIAEGVETEIYVELLKKYGCHYAQGYFYSKPVSVNDFNKLYDKA